MGPPPERRVHPVELVVVDAQEDPCLRAPPPGSHVIQPPRHVLKPAPLPSPAPRASRGAPRAGWERDPREPARQPCTSTPRGIGRGASFITTTDPTHGLGQLRD